MPVPAGPKSAARRIPILNTSVRKNANLKPGPFVAFQKGKAKTKSRKKVK